MKLTQAIAAVKDGLACHDIGQIDTAKALFREAMALFDVADSRPMFSALHACGSHSSVLDAYEFTNQHAHLEEISA